MLHRRAALRAHRQPMGPGADLRRGIRGPRGGGGRRARLPRRRHPWRGVRAADDLASTVPIWLILTQSFWNARFRRYVPEFGARMSETLLRQMDNGAGHSAVALQQAMFERTRIFREVQAWFEDYDIVATPTLSRTALAIDHDFFAPIEIDGTVADTVRNAWYPYTLPFNLSGNPAVTLPCGRGTDGLPIGLQLVGPHLGDARLLLAAALYETAPPCAGDRPPLPAG